MIDVNLCVLLLISLSLPAVFGNDNYFEHYINKHHPHKSNDENSFIIMNTATIATSTTTIGTNVLHSSDRNDNPWWFIETALPIIVALIFAILVLCCIVSCCKRCCVTENQGYIIEDTRINVPPQPLIMQTLQQPAVVQHLPPENFQEPVQRFPPQYQQPILSPTQYAPMQQTAYHFSPMQAQPSYSPVQQQTHYSPVHPDYPMMQHYNPSELPPPYESKGLK